MTSAGPLYAVIGGGLTGLCAAKALEEIGHGRVIVLEASDRLGGKLATGTVGDMTIEFGADSFLAREPWAVDLCRSLGLADELVAPAEYGALIWTAAGLKPLPTGFLRGFPSSVKAAIDAPVLSFPGALRTIGDLILPGPLSGPDVSLGEFARRRFGRELLERLVDPVLAGTRAGVAEEISLQAAAPEIDRIARTHRSVMRGLKKVRTEGRLETGTPPFLTLRPGMATLIDRLAETLIGTEIRTANPVDRLVPGSDGILVTTNTDRIQAHGVVLAVPAFVAADLLKDAAPDAATALSQIEYASVAGVSFVFADSVTLPAGSGMLVPRSLDRSISACTWFSKKWPQHAGSQGQTSIRCFIGRAGRQAVLEHDDEYLAKMALADLQDAIGLHAAPTATTVTRWERSLPQYRVGHLSLIERVETAISLHRIELAGAGYRGSGIPDCIKQGTEAARRLIQHL